jgi:hypothetical protein
MQGRGGIWVMHTLCGRWRPLVIVPDEARWAALGGAAKAFQPAGAFKAAMKWVIPCAMAGGRGFCCPMRVGAKSLQDQPAAGFLCVA